MIVNINGKEVEISGPVTLAGIIERKGLIPERIVVEYNKEIIPRERLGKITINEGDAIELVNFVGGGR